VTGRIATLGDAVASRLPRGTWLVAGVVAATVAILLATGEPLLALAPLVAVVAGWALLRMPVRWPVAAVIGLVLLADIVPSNLPGWGVWYPVT
jgi:hypothetical protein